MKFLNVSNARRALADLVDVTERTVITKNGEPAAVLLSVPEYRALTAWRSLTRQPETLKRVLEAHERIQAGDLSQALPLEPASERLVTEAARPATKKAASAG